MFSSSKINSIVLGKCGPNCLPHSLPIVNSDKIRQTSKYILIISIQS